MPDSVDSRLDQECRWAECDAPPSVLASGSMAGGETLESGGDSPGLQAAGGGATKGEAGSWPPAAPARAPGPGAGAGAGRPRGLPPALPARCSSQDQILGRGVPLAAGPGLARATPSGRAARLPPALPLLLALALPLALPPLPPRTSLARPLMVCAHTSWLRFSRQARLWRVDRMSSSIVSTCREGG